MNSGKQRNDGGAYRHMKMMVTAHAKSGKDRTKAGKRKKAKKMTNREKLNEVTELWPLEKLARRVCEERSQIVRIGNEKEVPNYMFNLRHPTIRTLYDGWRTALHAIPFPPDDLERITWELEFLNEAALMKIQSHFEALDKAADALRQTGGDAG